MSYWVVYFTADVSTTTTASTPISTELPTTATETTTATSSTTTPTTPETTLTTTTTTTLPSTTILSTTSPTTTTVAPAPGNSITTHYTCITLFLNYKWNVLGRWQYRVSINIPLLCFSDHKSRIYCYILNFIQWQGSNVLHFGRSQPCWWISYGFDFKDFSAWMSCDPAALVH